MPRVWRKIKTYLGTGLFIVLPAVVTGYLLWSIFRFADGLLGSLLERVIHRRVPGLGVLAMVILLFLAGLAAANYLGKRLIGWIEDLLAHVPLVGGIYGTTRQFAEALSSPERGVFRRVVLVEYPRAGLYSVGFLTGNAPADICRAAGQELADVFVPTVPNPTSGFLIHVPAQDVVYLSMSIDEGVKFIVSAGVVQPSALVPREGEAQ